MTSTRDLENRFLGSLLGLAIGDALGMPVAEMPVDEARNRFGEIRDYQPRNQGADDEIPAGEITDETETVLCIVESMTTNNGRLDPENINARLMFLAEGPSRYWMPEEMRAGIVTAFDHDGLLPEDASTDGSLATALRGVPIGLIHSIGGFDRDAFIEESRLVSRLSHGGIAQHQLVLDVAVGVASLVRGERVEPVELDGDLSGIASERAVVADLLARVRQGSAFDDVVFHAVNSHRPADSAGAIAGALSGAKVGAADIPQALIDGLEARVYLSLAAPWFYRTATRRAGTLIDLRQV